MADSDTTVRLAGRRNSSFTMRLLVTLRLKMSTNANAQLTFTYSKSIIKTLKKGVKHVES